MKQLWLVGPDLSNDWVPSWLPAPREWEIMSLSPFGSPFDPVAGRTWGQIVRAAAEDFESPLVVVCVGAEVCAAMGVVPWAFDRLGATLWVAGFDEIGEDPADPESGDELRQRRLVAEARRLAASMCHADPQACRR